MAGRLLGAADLPPALRQALLDKAEGVPLFIEEVIRTLLDLGMLRKEGDRYRVVEGVGHLNVPDTIQGIIMARLDRLGEDGKRTVQLASVIGRQFLGRLLQRVAGLADRLAGLLNELKDLEIIYELGWRPSLRTSSSTRSSRTSRIRACSRSAGASCIGRSASPSRRSTPIG
jgi:predicted ATPase